MKKKERKKNIINADEKSTKINMKKIVKKILKENREFLIFNVQKFQRKEFE